MKKDPFQYIFRFCCDPGFNDAEEIPALLRYVDEADIDDVGCIRQRGGDQHWPYEL